MGDYKRNKCSHGVNEQVCMTILLLHAKEINDTGPTGQTGVDRANGGLVVHVVSPPSPTRSFPVKRHRKELLCIRSCRADKQTVIRD